MGIRVKGSLNIGQSTSISGGTTNFVVDNSSIVTGTTQTELFLKYFTTIKLELNDIRNGLKVIGSTEHVATSNTSFEISVSGILIDYTITSYLVITVSCLYDNVLSKYSVSIKDITVLGDSSINLNNYKINILTQ